MKWHLCRLYHSRRTDISPMPWKYLVAQDGFCAELAGAKYGAYRAEKDFAKQFFYLGRFSILQRW